MAFGVEAFLCRGVPAGPVAFITGGVHGDEYEGPAAVADLTRRLSPDRMRGSVIAIPVANPMAHAAAQRTSPEDGLNLARTFPGNSEGPPTERLAASLFSSAREADYVIDLHSGGVEYRFTPLAGFYGEPVPGNRSFEAARRFGLPVLWQLPRTKGVLSSEAWKTGVPAIGTEYLGAGQLAKKGVNSYVAGVLSCLALWGICPEERLLPESGEVCGGDWLTSEAEGIFHAHCELGEPIERGREVADIRSVRGEILEQLVADRSGIVIAVRSKAYIRKGDYGVLIGSPI